MPPKFRAILGLKTGAPLGHPNIPSPTSSGTHRPDATLFPPTTTATLQAPAAHGPPSTTMSFTTSRPTSAAPGSATAASARPTSSKSSRPTSGASSYTPSAASSRPTSAASDASGSATASTRTSVNWKTPVMLTPDGCRVVQIVVDEFTRVKWDANKASWVVIAEKCKSIIPGCTTQAKFLANRIKKDLLQQYETMYKGRDPGMQSGSGAGENAILVTFRQVYDAIKQAEAAKEGRETKKAAKKQQQEAKAEQRGTHMPRYQQDPAYILQSVPPASVSVLNSETGTASQPRSSHAPKSTASAQVESDVVVDSSSSSGDDDSPAPARKRKRHAPPQPFQPALTLATAAQPPSGLDPSLTSKLHEVLDMSHGLLTSLQAQYK